MFFLTGVVYSLYVPPLLSCGGVVSSFKRGPTPRSRQKSEEGGSEVLLLSFVVACRHCRRRRRRRRSPVHASLCASTSGVLCYCSAQVVSCVGVPPTSSTRRLVACVVAYRLLLVRVPRSIVRGIVSCVTASKLLVVLALSVVVRRFVVSCDTAYRVFFLVCEPCSGLAFRPLYYSVRAAWL